MWKRTEKLIIFHYAGTRKTQRLRRFLLSVDRSVSLSMPLNWVDTEHSAFDPEDSTTGRNVIETEDPMVIRGLLLHQSLQLLVATLWRLSESV